MNPASPLQAPPWYRSLIAVFLVSVVFPPAGLVLLWMRPRTGVARKLLGSVAIVALGISYLFRLGLHWELDGSGIRPVFSFYKPQAHYAALERSREQQRVVAASAPAQEEPAPAPSAAPTASEPPPKAPAKVAASTPSQPLPAPYWTGFRGPRRDGRYDETPVLTKWLLNGPPLLWRQPVGGGYGSFAIVGGLAFTIEQRRSKEAVAAYDLDTGREVWTDSWEGRFYEPLGGEGPRTTPTWDDGRLYVLGAAGEFRCLEAKTGKRLWAKNILEENSAPNLQWAMAASPLIVEEKVIVLPGGSAGKSVVAYNKLTGETIWKSLDDKQSYTSPMLVTLAGKRQLIIVSARRAMGLDPENGSLLWEYPWTTEYDINAAQPIVIGENRFFLSASYGHGAAVVEVSKTDAGFAVRTVWANTRMKNKFTSSVLHEGYIYGLDEAILACVDAETGALKWKGGRYGYGQLVLASGQIIVLTETGDLVLVKATPERHEELARFSALHGKTWNHPALAAGRLLVRNTTEMACFRIGAE